MTRPLLRPDTGQRRIRLTTAITAATATAAAALCGVVLAHSDPAQAAESPQAAHPAEAGPSPVAAPPAQTEPSPQAASSPTTLGRVIASQQPQRHLTRRPAPVQPPPQPPARSSGRGNASSGAS